MNIIVTFILLVFPLLSSSFILCPNQQQQIIQSLSNSILINGCPDMGSLPTSIHDYTLCCDRHQICYQICSFTKNYCDEEFKYCLSQLCENIQGIEQSYQCEKNMNIIYQEITSSNIQEYEDYQLKSCECIDINLLESAYFNYFQNFYLNHAPDKVIKGLELIKKEINKSNDRPNAFSKIFYELHKKYDAAVTQTYRRQNCPNYPKYGESWSLTPKHSK